MNGFVLRRTDQGGGYVARTGNGASYTYRLAQIRIFGTRESAERERCVENEVIEPVDSLFNNRGMTL